MDNITENAEIEAEIEAENIIRYKNSKLFTITMIGLVIVLITFLKTEQHTNTLQRSFSKESSTPDAIATRKKELPASLQDDFLSSRTPAPIKNPTKVSKVFQNFSLKKNKAKTTKNFEGKHIPKSALTKQTINAHSAKFYVQLGAFSIKKNAIRYAKQIESKGFKTILSVKNIKSKHYQILKGSFSKKSNSITEQADLKAFGFNSVIKRINSLYTLDLGSYNYKESSSLIDKLKKLRLKPTTKEISVQSKSYAVRVQGFATKSEAQKIRKQLANHGFKNSFIG